MKVYVAASSEDIDRAGLWMDRLAHAGLEVTSNWIDVIANVGQANPREATNPARRRWANEDLHGVAAADIVWCLVPERATGRGAYFELGYALGIGKHLVLSGDTRQSIFCALGKEFNNDEEAFRNIVDTADAISTWEGL